MGKVFSRDQKYLKQRIDIFGNFSELNKEFWEFKRDQKVFL